MSIDLKGKIHEAIDKRSNDDDFLREILSVIESYDKNIAGYDLEGNSISYSQLQEELENASKKMDDGEFLTSEEVKNRISNWK